MRWRITGLAFTFGILYVFLISNIYSLQVEKRSDSLIRAEFLGKPRGNIYFIDKNNNLTPAALNKEYPTVYADPEETGLKAALYAEKLSPLINKSVEELEKILSKLNDTYELLLQKAESWQVEKIKDLNLKGIYIKNESLRFYPFKELASHVLGFTDPTNEVGGRYGAELQFNDLLNDKNLVLTIDHNIQDRAEKILRKIIEKYRAVAGTIIIQEPQTGKILAMGNSPSFDPNNYSKFKIGTFLNPAVQAVYEPGSVFKVITMAAGIDSGKITPETSYFDIGSVTLNGKTIKNWDLRVYGEQTMLGVIENSINTGSVFAQRKIGQDIFYNYLIKFGFNKPTGVVLPGEINGNINNLKTGKDINFATASFGQGVSVTPIELINAFSAIANNGVLMKPLILADEKPQEIRRVVSRETARKVVEMMVSAVEKNKVAAISNYSVAGKTGTSFVPDFGNKGYTEEVINTYVGFAPASNPRFVILIKLDKPAGAPLAGQSVVPAFRELAQFILNYYNIAPDKL